MTWAVDVKAREAAMRVKEWSRRPESNRGPLHYE